MQIQLHQVIIAFPALIPQTVIVIGITVESDAVEPPDIRGILTIPKHIAKRTEASSGMVEHTVQHDFDTVLVQSITNLFKILIGSQPHIDFSVIPGVITMCVRFKYGRKIDGIRSQLFHMRNPV